MRATARTAARTAESAITGGGRPGGATVTRPAFLVGGSDRDFRTFVYGLLGVSIRMDRLREAVGALMGLSGLQYHIVMVIAEQGDGEPVRVRAVADALHVSGAYVTMETRKLARLGLIAKRPAPEDRRGVLLALTPAGREAVAAIAPSLREINDALFEGIGRADYAQFRTLVARMVPNADRALRRAERFVADRMDDRVKPETPRPRARAARHQGDE